MSKSKQIGTAGETGVRNYLLSLGYSELDAHRNVLKGSADEGDVWLRQPWGLIVFEVKSGKAAEKASLQQVRDWYLEAQAERDNARATIGVLVVKRPAVSPKRAGEWWCYWTSEGVMVRSTLDEYMGVVRRVTP